MASMYEVRVTLLCSSARRRNISELELYAEDGTGRIVQHASYVPETTEAHLQLPVGQYEIYTLFASGPFRYYEGAQGIRVPRRQPVVLDLDQATVDEVLVPPA